MSWQVAVKLASRISVLLLALSLLPGPVLAEDRQQRLEIGLNLLPAVIAANTRLAATDKSEILPIYLVYRDNRHFAEQLIPGIGNLQSIKGHPLQVQVISIDELIQIEASPIGAVFLAQPMGNRLDELVKFAGEQRVLLFSPFKGDVERGVATGFRVTHKVSPMINKGALNDSKIKLKAFFLRTVVIHE